MAKGGDKMSDKQEEIEEVKDILRENGLGSEDELTKDNLVNAIATAIATSDFKGEEF